jgi:hypothetical protein
MRIQQVKNQYINVLVFLLCLYCQGNKVTEIKEIRCHRIIIDKTN